MSKIKLDLMSKLPHISQIITGFYYLSANGGHELEISYKNIQYPYMAVVKAEYKGIKIIYDLLDGYQYPEEMSYYLNNCDCYFKRSYSEQKNSLLFSECENKIHPLGFNYNVTYRDNPLNEPKWKSAVKLFLGKTPGTYYIPEVFEEDFEHREITGTILFLTRLWNYDTLEISDELKYERKYINKMRIDLIKGLRKNFGNRFIGGLEDNDIARCLAPDLIVSKKYTEKRKYLNLLHSSDICIASMGLHGSIGWKTGEYIASSKAIVSEYFRYSVPGNFCEGKNYLGFITVDECINSIDTLVSSPQKIYDMQKNNHEYYSKYLKPDILVKNTLDFVDNNIINKENIYV